MDDNPSANSQTELWRLDELAYAGRENLDPDHVARYDNKEQAEAKTEVQDLADSKRIDSTSTVIDLGAGTGQFALAVASLCKRVVAVDPSPVMYDHLRQAIDRRDTMNIEAVRAGFLTYEHIGEAVDLVYTRYALHHIPDFWKAMALNRIATMLRSGGTLRLWDVVYSFEPGEATTRLNQWINETASDNIEEGWTREELVEHIRDEHSTFNWLLDPMLRHAGFRIDDVRHSQSAVFSRYLCTKI